MHGINGPIWGKVGTVVGSSRNGIPYLKARSKGRTLTVSEAELANRKKFAAAQAWLKPLRDFVREGFRGYSQRSHGFIAAKSSLLKNAFVNDAKGMRIDPALVKVSSGNIALPEDLSVKLLENAELEFTWNPAKKDKVNDEDQIMMLAYDVELVEALYKTTGQFRKTGSDTLSLAGNRGKNYHVYAAFNAADRSRQSESVYLGEFKI